MGKVIAIIGYLQVEDCKSMNRFETDQFLLRVVQIRRGNRDNLGIIIHIPSSKYILRPIIRTVIRTEII